jgi:predicted flap endonuclease-1-like 5' DNA nuclease
MEAKKPKISHYELLMRACDKTKAEYERILTKEASSKHFWKTASSDFSKSEVKILKKEYQKAKLRRKAKKLSVEISELRLKAWAKTHDVEDKIYELTDNGQSADNQSTSSDSNKKSNKKAKKHPLAIVIVPTEIKKPSKVVEAAVEEPKKRGKVAKPKSIEVADAEPKKQGKVAKLKPVEVATSEPKKRGRIAKPKIEEVVTKVAAEEPKKAVKVAKPKPVATEAKVQKGRPKTEKAAVAPATDLTLLEGIGAKVKEILGNAGITTFAQLAASKEEDIKSILVANKFRFGNPPTMIEQAKLAAAGKMTELEALKEELKGGRRK